MSQDCLHTHVGLGLACVLPHAHAGHHQYLDDFEQKWRECGGGCGLVRGHDGEHQYSSWPEPPADDDLCQQRRTVEGVDYFCTKRRGHSGFDTLHGQKRKEGGGFVATWSTEEPPNPYRTRRLRFEDPIVSVTYATDLERFAKLPLPVKMRAAADVLEEANRMVPADPNNEWQPSVLRDDADVWEREEAQKDEKARAVEELTQTLGTLLDDEISTNAIARTLIDAGWTKVTE